MVRIPPLEGSGRAHRRGEFLAPEGDVFDAEMFAGETIFFRLKKPDYAVAALHDPR
jgi:hypothetical protein